MTIHNFYSQKADQNLQNLFNSQPSARNVQDNTGDGCNGTILILPHCETLLVPSVDVDGNGNGNVDVNVDGNKVSYADSCSWVGLKRSDYLITQFGKDRRWPVHYASFVLGEKKKRTRAIQTISPVQEYYKDHDPELKLYSDRGKLVNDISEMFIRGEVCNTLITLTPSKMIDIPRFAFDLGCGPLNSGDGCPMLFREGDFDRAWELQFIFGVDDDYAYSDSNGDDNGGDGSKTAEEESTKRWKVYGNVVRERFDPLAFGKLVGEYDPPISSSSQSQQNDSSDECYFGWTQTFTPIYPTRISVVA